MLGRRQPVSLGRSRRVLVQGHAGHGRGVHRRRRQCGLLLGEHVLWQVRMEGDEHDVMVGYKAFFKDDPLLGTAREAEVTTFWSDVVVARPENAMTGVSFTRGGYHRIGRNVTAGLGRLHRAPRRPLDLRRHRSRATATCSAPRRRSWATSATAACSPTVTGCRTRPARTARPSTFEILGTCPTQHFTRETAPRPPRPGEPSELEYIASRLFGTRSPRRWSASGTATPCWAPTPTRRAPPCSPRDRPTGPTGWRDGTPDRADHPQRADPLGLAAPAGAGRSGRGDLDEHVTVGQHAGLVARGRAQWS